MNNRDKREECLIDRTKALNLQRELRSLDLNKQEDTLRLKEIMREIGKMERRYEKRTGIKLFDLN